MAVMEPACRMLHRTRPTNPTSSGGGAAGGRRWNITTFCARTMRNRVSLYKIVAGRRRKPDKRIVLVVPLTAQPGRQFGTVLDGPGKKLRVGVEEDPQFFPSLPRARWSTRIDLRSRTPCAKKPLSSTFNTPQWNLLYSTDVVTNQHPNALPNLVSVHNNRQTSAACA